MELPCSSRRRSGRMWSLGVFCILCVLKAKSLTAMLNSVTLSALSNSISLVQTNYGHSVLSTSSHPLIQLMPSFLWETRSDQGCNCLPCPTPAHGPVPLPVGSVFSLFLQVKCLLYRACSCLYPLDPMPLCPVKIIGVTILPLFSPS